MFPTASVPSMVGTHEYHGFWWLPGHQDQKLAGKLTLGKGDVQLELLGHYGHELLSDSGTERIFSLDLKEQPRVVGMTTNGKQVTLVRPPQRQLDDEHSGDRDFDLPPRGRTHRQDVRCRRRDRIR